MEVLKKSGDPLVILFGSRARGDHTPLSDFDLLVISDEKPPEAPSFIQLFWFSREEVERRIRDFDTILIDALIEGKVLYDGRGEYSRLRSLAEVEIERRGLVKTEMGWVRRKGPRGRSGRVK